MELNKILFLFKLSIGFKLFFDMGLFELILLEFVVMYGVEVKNGIGYKDNFYYIL